MVPLGLGVDRDLLRSASEHLAALAQEHYERASLLSGRDPRRFRAEYETCAKLQRLATDLNAIIGAP